MITLRATSDLDLVGALWISLLHHHQRCGQRIGELAAPVADETSWAIRRRQYESWSAEPGWLLIVAESEGSVCGYAAARVTPSASSWDFGTVVGRLETLVVAAEARGRGVGAALVDAVRGHWRHFGVTFASVSVIAGNDAAQRFYERLGAVEFTRTSYFPV